MRGMARERRVNILERINIILNAHHRRRVDWRVLENFKVNFAILGHAEQLWNWPWRRVRLQTFNWNTSMKKNRELKFDSNYNSKWKNSKKSKKKFKQIILISNKPARGERMSMP
jgi:hypothetical protein